MSQIIEHAEALRRQAIEMLIAERQEIELTLATLGYDGTSPNTTVKPKLCSVCGSSEHNARSHKKDPGSHADGGRSSVSIPAELTNQA